MESALVFARMPVVFLLVFIFLRCSLPQLLRQTQQTHNKRRHASEYVNNEAPARPRLSCGPSRRIFSQGVTVRPPGGRTA
jgi:hypothetical protein